MDEWERQLERIDHPRKALILDALRDGADIHSTRTPSTPRYARNLLSAQGSANEEKILDEIVKEVLLERWAGPFRKLPFNNLVFLAKLLFVGDMLPITAATAAKDGARSFATRR